MNIKKWFLLLLCLTFFNAVSFGQSQEKKFKLVIDAGHGGEDPGCKGRKSMEKNVTLNVALKLGKLISDNFDDVQVIYTRKTDVFVEVYKRAVIANNNHADLFISLHCNAAENRSAHGVETWVMGLDKSGANMEVAKRENAAILKEKNFENNYEGFNPNSPEANVIFSLHTSAYMNHSIMLADKVQRNLVRNTHLVDRTVRPGGFWVLYKVAMPSILVELGFLTNATEEEYMIKPTSQDIMAVSIYNAFVEYRNALDGGSRKTLPLPKVTETKDVASADSRTVDTEVAPEPAQKKAVVDDAVASEPTTAKAEDTPKTFVNIEKISTKEKETVSPEPQKINTTETAKSENEAAKPQARIRFRVQIAATPENIAITDSRFSMVKDVRKFHEGKFWKYTCGNTTTLEEAQTLLKSVKTYFPDAFVIAFDGETKIPVSEAVNRINK
ncbi:MAG: N-acetylmuramoyl-L-alanine amidase [Bacteroidales bacterium]|nr:N-acetylmuramoyl-L-alanine amidase [Bacteroidales bacterium]